MPSELEPPVDADDADDVILNVDAISRENSVQGDDNGADEGHSKAVAFEDDVEDFSNEEINKQMRLSETLEMESNGHFTHIDPPGPDVFATWVGQDIDDDESALSPSVHEVDRAIRRFMGPFDQSRAKQYQRLRLQKDAGEDGVCKPKKTHYESVSYKMLDTPIWHHQTMLLNHRKRSERRFTELRKWFTCRGRQKEDPISAFRRDTQWVTRIVLIVIGFLSSCVGFCVSIGSDKLLEAKINFTTNAVGDPAHFGEFIGFNLAFAFIAFLPVAYRPVSAGSGIAEAKAVLNGIVVPQCTELLSALMKAISVIFTGAASLPVGLEGPMIFICLSLGENANRFIPKTYPTLHLDRYRRDFAAVGTACGVTAAFFSPIGGVLFAMEEGSSFWSVLLNWRCFAGACVTAIFSYLWVYMYKDMFGKGFDVIHLAKYHGLIGQENVVPTYHIWDYAVFALIGILAGILGAIWCNTNRFLAIGRNKLGLKLPWKLAEILFLTSLMSVMVWWLPMAYKVCGSYDNTLASEEYYRQFGCPDGQYNHLATLLLNPPGSVGLNLLYYEPMAAFSAGSCLIAGAIYWSMLLLLFGCSVSMGIFIPLLYIGACFGRALGIWWQVPQDVLPTYAIVTSVAVLGGVARVLISITAIMAATTGYSYLVTPFMVCTLFAKVTGKAVFQRPGIYDIILQLKGVPFLEEEPPHEIEFRGLRAEDIMSPPPLISLDPEANVGELLEILKKYPFADFPITDKLRGGALVGVVTRSDLQILLSNRSLFCEKGDKASNKALRQVELLNRQHKPPLLEDITESLTEEDLAKVLDLTPYLEIAHYTFDRRGSAERAYEIFRSQGLRELIITGPNGRPVGAITRYDLAVLEELGDSEERIKKNRQSVGVYGNS